MTGERVEAAGELRALPAGTVVLDVSGMAWQQARRTRTWHSVRGDVESASALTKDAPFIVVRRPDRDLIADAYAQGGRDALAGALAQLDAEYDRVLRVSKAVENVYDDGRLEALDTARSIVMSHLAAATSRDVAATEERAHG